MAPKFFSERNLRFLLDEVFDVASLTRYDAYKDYDGKMFEMVLKAATELAEGSCAYLPGNGQDSLELADV